MKADQLDANLPIFVEMERDKSHLRIRVGNKINPEGYLFDPVELMFPNITELMSKKIIVFENGATEFEDAVQYVTDGYLLMTDAKENSVSLSAEFKLNGITVCLETVIYKPTDVTYNTFPVGGLLVGGVPQGIAMRNIVTTFLKIKYHRKVVSDNGNVFMYKIFNNCGLHFTTRLGEYNHDSKIFKPKEIRYDNSRNYCDLNDQVSTWNVKATGYFAFNLTDMYGITVAIRKLEDNSFRDELMTSRIYDCKVLDGDDIRFI